MTTHRLALLLLLTPALAHADSSKAQADVLFAQGEALVRDGKLAEGCAAFEASQKLDPATTTLVRVADCRDKNHQYATAWGMFLQVEREIRGNTDDSSAKLRAVVTARAAALEKRLSTIEIQVPEGSRFDGLEILRDNDRVEAGAWGHALPLDGGTYRISARAPGHREWTTTIVLGPEHDVQTVVIPALAAEHASPPPPPPPPRPAPRAIAPFVIGGAALVLGGGAVFFELSARSVYSDAQAATDRAHQVDLWNSANTRHWAAGGLTLAAAAGAGVATYLYVRHRRHEVAVTPVVTGTSGGLSIGGVW